MKRHLAPDGRIVIDQFDPLLTYLVDERRDVPLSREEVRHPERGTLVRCEVVERTNDRVRQVFHEIWRFTESDDAGNLLREERETMSMRWSYRQEMRHLFELAGLDVVAETSDFFGSPPAYGREQVFVLRDAQPPA